MSKGTYHHYVKDMYVAFYVVANDSESCSRRDMIQEEVDHGRTLSLRVLQHSA